MSKHRTLRPGNDFELQATQHRISKNISKVILPLGIIALVGILAGLAIAEVVM